MEVFNLAEELEKERKKNKELEERIKEFKLTIRIQFQQIQELIDREDKAINNIEKVLNMYEEVKDKELLTNAVVHIECYKELYDLLKGK